MRRPAVPFRGCGLAALGLFMLACSEDNVVIEVDVRRIDVPGDAGAIDLLSVATTIGVGDAARPSNQPDPQVRDDLRSFLVQFPASRLASTQPDGTVVPVELPVQVQVAVRGIGSALGCQIASGAQALPISGPGRYRLTIDLMADPGCLLKVKKSGDGRGAITTEPPGLRCGKEDLGPCVSAPFKLEQRVTLIPAIDLTDPGSIFAGWSGVADCPGTGTCQITITDAPITVTATFLPRKVCSDSDWCWENPRPQGNTLNGVFGFGAADAWIVGNHGAILHWNGAFWTPSASGTKANLNAVWGARSDDVWAAGDGGTLIHFDGTKWGPSLSPLMGGSAKLHGLWGSGPKDIWAVGGVILHWEGAIWAQVPSGTTDLLDGVWGFERDDVWAAGNTGTVLHWDGKAWQPRPMAARAGKLWGRGPDDIWTAGGLKGDIQHWNGADWKPYTNPSGLGIASFWGPGGPAKDAWAVGLNGNILHWNGQDGAWHPAHSGTPYTLLGVWGSGPDDVWAVGNDIDHWDGTSWRPSLSSVTPKDLLGVWADGPETAWGVGRGGAIVHLEDRSWNAVSSPTDKDLQAVWGHAGPAGLLPDVWAVGNAGTVLHWNGTTWSRVPSGTTADLAAVWGSGQGDVWAVGSPASGQPAPVLQFTGPTTAPATEVPPTTRPLLGVWGSGPDDVWAVGEGGTILHRSAGKWSAINIASLTTYKLAAVWGSRATDIWVAGDVGTLLHYDGKAWSRPPSSTPFHLAAVSGTGQGDVWAAGDAGTLVHCGTAGCAGANSGTNNALSGLWILPGGQAYAVGTKGTILSHHP